MPQGFRNPAENGMEYKDVWITTRDKVQLHGWFIKAHRLTPRQFRAIVFFHGNAGNIGARLPNIEMQVKVLKCNVLIIDYRGFGNSQSEPSEEGLALDAEATLEHALNDPEIDNDKLYVFGRSIGGSVAIRLAETKANYMKGLIIENTFTSIGDMVDNLMPLVAKFKTFIQRVFYPSIDRIPQITTPILFIRGLKDQIVPCTHSERLHKAAKNAPFKMLHSVVEGDHNDCFQKGGQEYVDAHKQFFARCEMPGN